MVFRRFHQGDGLRRLRNPSLPRLLIVVPRSNFRTGAPMQVFVVGSFVLACSVKVARLPRAGESLIATAFVAEPGGKGFNVALALKRLGAGVDGAFAVGRDTFAAVAFSAFERAGLSADMLVSHDGPTGAGVGFIDDAGENCLAVSPGANLLLDRRDVAGAARLGAGDLCIATFESPDAAIGQAFSHARSRGAITMLNPSPSRPISPDILQNCDILVLNRIEASDLGLPSPADVPGDMEPQLEGVAPIVVVTLGEDGALAFERGEKGWRCPAYAVPVVDTIGSGDAFTAGLAVGLLKGLPLRASLQEACACGALTAARLGTFDAFPTADELARFLTEHALDA
jgi:ribokinase